MGKTRWPSWPLIGWDIFDFSSETAERNSTKFDRKQDLNVLYQVCVFRADRNNKMAALASDWLRHFRLLLWNRWTEFNETWQEARSQHPLPSLCFSCRSKNKNVRLGRFLKKSAHCTQVYDMWPFGPLVMLPALSSDREAIFCHLVIFSPITFDLAGGANSFNAKYREYFQLFQGFWKFQWTISFYTVFDGQFTKLMGL